MSYDQHIIDYLRTRLQSAFGGRLKRLILFGSRARGDAEEDSDYDVLVLLENRNNNDDNCLAEIWVSALVDLNIIVGFFVATEQTFNTMPFEPVFMNIRREGVLL